MLVASLLFVVLLLPQTISAEISQKVERDFYRDGFRKMKISSFADDIASYIGQAVEQAKEDFNSTGTECYERKESELAKEIDDIFDHKMKEYLGEILLDLPDSLTGAEIHSMFQDLIDYLKESEIDKLKTVANDAITDAGNKLDAFITNNVKSKLVEDYKITNKGNNKPRGKKKKPNQLVKVEQESKVWDLNDVVIVIDGSLKKFNTEMVELLSKESNEIIMTLDVDIEDVKDEFIKNMVSSFGSENVNSNSEDPEPKDVTDSTEMGSDEVDEDANEEKEISEIKEDSEDSLDSEDLQEEEGDRNFGNADPSVIEMASNAQEEIRRYGESLISSQRDEFSGKIEEVVKSTVDDLAPSATEDEKSMIVEETVESVMEFNMKELEMGVQISIDVAISNIEDTVKEGGEPKEIERDIMEDKINCFREIKDVTYRIGKGIMSSTLQTVSKLTENVIEELGIDHD